MSIFYSPAWNTAIYRCSLGMCQFRNKSWFRAWPLISPLNRSRETGPHYVVINKSHRMMDSDQVERPTSIRIHLFRYFACVEIAITYSDATCLLLPYIMECIPLVILDSYYVCIHIIYNLFSCIGQICDCLIASEVLRRDGLNHLLMLWPWNVWGQFCVFQLNLP